MNDIIILSKEFAKQLKLKVSNYMTAQIIQLKRKKKDQEYFETIQKYEYFNSLYIAQLDSMKNSNGVIGSMHNIFGNIKKDIKDKFLSFFNAPDYEKWISIRSYLIDSSTTAWQLWIKFDKNAPVSGSSKIFPEPAEFIKYLNQHQQQRLQELKLKCDELILIINSYEN